MSPPSVWRPLHKPIEDWPLAVCDARSLDNEDLVAADRVSPEYAGEIYYVKSNANHEWYWLSRQSPDEITIFVSFDSEPKGTVNCESSLSPI